MYESASGVLNDTPIVEGAKFLPRAVVELTTFYKKMYESASGVLNDYSKQYSKRENFVKTSISIDRIL